MPNTSKSEKIVLAYSGGLDTSIIIPWLKENYSYEVIAMVADVGQGDDVEAVVDKAYKTGATKVVVEDLREEFLTDYVLARTESRRGVRKQISAGHFARASHDREASGGSSSARRRNRRRHGCTGKGNDQVRFEMAYQALAPELKVVAPWREWDLKSREDCLDYAEKRGISVAASREKIHSRDRNLWHISHEGGELEDAGNAPFASTWQITKSPQEAPDKEEQVEIGFEKGVPVSVNGQTLDPVSLVELLNEIGGRNAIGRIDLVENRFVGIKSRGCYETPGGTMLLAAHNELEALCLDRDLVHFKQHVGLKYAELVYFGLWFTPLREALDAFVETTQQNLTGSSRCRSTKETSASSAASRITPFIAPTSLRSPWAQVTIRKTPRVSSASWDCPRVAALKHSTAVYPRGRCTNCRSKPSHLRASLRRLRNEDVVWPLPATSSTRHSKNGSGLSPTISGFLPFELAASRAHANALEHAGVLSTKELSEIVKGLGEIGRRALSEPGFLNDPEAEDVHHFVEKQLAALIGATGYKSHTGRSRNEQIATDLRLFVRQSIDTIQNSIADCIEAFLARAEAAGSDAMPAYTHLQPAEPVLVAHWLLTYVEMLIRDSTRFADCRKRLNFCPLGSGAVAGRHLHRPRSHGRRVSLRRPDDKQHRRH